MPRFSPLSDAGGLLEAMQLSKAGRRECLVLTPPLSLTFEICVLDNLNIDCVAGHFTQLLNLVRVFCVDMAPSLLDRFVPRACVTGQSSNQGGGQI